jgi:hypothetical protein
MLKSSEAISRIDLELKSHVSEISSVSIIRVDVNVIDASDIDPDDGDAEDL